MDPESADLIARLIADELDAFSINEVSHQPSTSSYCIGSSYEDYEAPMSSYDRQVAAWTPEDQEIEPWGPVEDPSNNPQDPANVIANMPWDPARCENDGWPTEPEDAEGNSESTECDTASRTHDTNGKCSLEQTPSVEGVEEDGNNHKSEDQNPPKSKKIPTFADSLIDLASELDDDQHHPCAKAASLIPDTMSSHPSTSNPRDKTQESLLDMDSDDVDTSPASTPKISAKDKGKGKASSDDVDDGHTSPAKPSAKDKGKGKASSYGNVAGEGERPNGRGISTYTSRLSERLGAAEERPWMNDLADADASAEPYLRRRRVKGASHLDIKYTHDRTTGEPVIIIPWPSSPQTPLHSRQHRQYGYHSRDMTHDDERPSDILSVTEIHLGENEGDECKVIEVFSGTRMYDGSIVDQEQGERREVSWI